MWVNFNSNNIVIGSPWKIGNFTVGAIIYENRFEGITQPRMHQFEKSLCPSSRGDLDNS